MNWSEIVTAGVSFILTMIGVVVTLSLNWSKFDKRLSLMHQRIDIIEGNHIKTIQDQMIRLSTETQLIRESQIRIEEKLKNNNA